MSLETPEKIRSLQRKLYCKAKAEPSVRFYLLYVPREKVHGELGVLCLRRVHLGPPP
jgi:hypothetical protein